MKTRWLAYALALSALTMFGTACTSGGSGITCLMVLQVSPEDARTDPPAYSRLAGSLT